MSDDSAGRARSRHQLTPEERVRGTAITRRQRENMRSNALDKLRADSGPVLKTMKRSPDEIRSAQRSVAALITGDPRFRTGAERERVLFIILDALGIRCRIDD